MDRIGILIQKLQEQHQEHAAKDQLLQTVQLLQREIAQAGSISMQGEKKKIAVLRPYATPVAVLVGVQPPIPQEESIQSNGSAYTKSKGQALSSGFDYANGNMQPANSGFDYANGNMQPASSGFDYTNGNMQPAGSGSDKADHNESASPKESRFDVLEEVPTLSHQPNAIKDLNQAMSSERPSLNDKLKEEKTEVADRLQGSPVRDLRKAIGINDRYRFITELFRGDEAMYERSLKTINHFSIFAEAQYWIQRELKLKLGWPEDQATVSQFDQLVKRRFL